MKNYSKSLVRELNKVDGATSALSLFLSSLVILGAVVGFVVYSQTHQKVSINQNTHEGVSISQKQIKTDIKNGGLKVVK